jgi:hypothetical protein
MAERAALFRPTLRQVKARLGIDNEGEPQLLLDPEHAVSPAAHRQGLTSGGIIKQRNYPARDEA